MAYLELALKTMEVLCFITKALVDKDPYVCKTAAISVAKLYANNDILVRREGLLDRLTALLNHGNANV